MSRTYLLLNFMGRMAAWMAGLGTVLGFIFTFLLGGLSISWYNLFAMRFGTVSGLILGAPIGFAMGLVTCIYYRKPTDEERYRLVMLLTAVVTTLAGGFVLNVALDSPAPASTFSIVIPVTIVLVYVSQHVAGWYVKQQLAAQKD